MSKIVVLALLFLVDGSPSLLGQMITAEAPADGGPISIVASGGSVVTGSLDFTSASGGLIPTPGGLSASAAPFTFFLSNTSNQVTYGMLGSNVEFEDGSCTTLTVGVEAGVEDVNLSWGTGATPVYFPVVIKEVTCAGAVPEPAAIQLLLAGLVGLCSMRSARSSRLVRSV